MVESWIFIFDGHFQLIGIDTTCNYHMWKHEDHLEMPHVGHSLDPWPWYLVVGLLPLCQSICQTTWSTWTLVVRIAFLIWIDHLKLRITCGTTIWCTIYLLNEIPLVWSCVPCVESSTTCRNDDRPLVEFDNFNHFLN